MTVLRALPGPRCLAVAALAIMSCAGLSAAPELAETAQGDTVADRAQISSARRYLVNPSGGVTIASAQAMLEALDISSALQPTVLSITCPDLQAAVVGTRLGAVLPSHGPSLLVLDTGRIGDDSLTAEPGTDFAPQGPNGDAITLRFQVNVPPGLNRLSFDYTFLSAESPDFVDSQFNDTFTATVSDALGENRVVVSASVNSRSFHQASSREVGAGPFLLFADNAAGVDEAFNQPSFLDADAGTTGLQRVNVAVAPGLVTIAFDIRDVGDGLLDSAVVLDHVAFSAVELVDPRPDLIDTFSGEVLRVPDGRLATGGAPIGAVAADGVTRVVLRSKVSGPGVATFSIMADGSGGSLSGVESGPNWGQIVRTNTVPIGDQWYVFALYRSPSSFNRGGDELATERLVALSMTYVPISGPRMVQGLSITLVRPPVVVVPDLWSNCLNWMEPGSLLDSAGDPARAAFHVTCADYAATSSKGLRDPANRRVVPDAIAEALSGLRRTGVAVTQADVVGHGMGGLLARQYIDAVSFPRFDNYLAGDIHRLLTMNTPHLGARLADEIVAFREFARQRDPIQWSATSHALETVGVRIDPAEGDLAIDDLTADSPAIDQLGTRGAPAVFYHALVSGGGRQMTRSQSLLYLPVGVRTLYLVMENQHPLTRNLPVRDRQKLIMGPQSMIFCTDAVAASEDDHDLFATTWEQQGGLSEPFISRFTMDPVVAVGQGHFLAQINARYVTRLIELLNAPVDSGLFATSMPSPREVARISHCPL